MFIPLVSDIQRYNFGVDFVYLFLTKNELVINKLVTDLCRIFFIRILILELTKQESTMYNKRGNSTSLCISLT